MKVTQELTTELARTLLLKSAKEANEYNESWAYWAYDVGVDDLPRQVADGIFVKVVAVESDEQDSYGNTGASIVIFRFLADDQGEEKFYKAEGRLSSYTSAWDNVIFTEVKGRQKTITVWE